MVTIKDVAKKAGVAVSTASNALNGKYGVKPETQKRVLKAAKELNYVPNPIAVGLVTNSTKNISMIVSGPSSFKFFSNPSFFEVIKSITAVLNENGYQSLLNIIDMEEETEAIPRIARGRTADALILIGTRREDKELANLLEEAKIPSMVVIREAPNDKIFGVSVDNQKCGYIATQYLLEMGHRSIGYIGALPGVSMAEDRLNGYRHALEEKGIVYDESLVVAGDYYQESGLVGVRQLLNKSSRRPTAIVAGNDLMALGAMEALEQEGIRIPHDISLVGCDNIPNLHLLRVPLTSVSVPFVEMGRLAAKKIIGFLEGEDPMESQIVLGPELRVRSSVKQIE